MRRLVKITASILLILSTCVACWISIDSPPRFAAHGGIGKEPIEKGQKKICGIYLQAWQPLHDITVSISVPQEVEIRAIRESVSLSGEKEQMEQLARIESPWTGGLTVTWNTTLVPKRRTALDSFWGRFNEKDADFEVILISKTDWKEWSSPIKARIELNYEGEKYTREFQMSHKGANDTKWQGKNASDLHLQ